jgi:hypothetical protein
MNLDLPSKQLGGVEISATEFLELVDKYDTALLGTSCLANNTFVVASLHIFTHNCLL